MDDEELARKGLQLLLKAHPFIHIVGECSNGLEAIDMVREKKPDLLFLDIRMPGLNGFETLAALEKPAPLTIFTTAYNAYAVEAFEANAIDYLLKPIEPSRLQKSINRIQARISGVGALVQKFALNEVKKTKINRILVRNGQRTEIINLKEIIYFEAQDDYVAIKTEKETYLKLERLGKLEEELKNSNFLRIHRSYLVNGAFLNRLEGHNKAILISGDVLPVSKSGYMRYFKE